MMQAGPGSGSGRTPLDAGPELTRDQRDAIEDRERALARARLVVPIFLGALLLATLVWHGIAVVESFEAVRALIGGLGWWGVALFIVVYAAVVLVHAPSTPFTLSAGVLYGYWGVPVAIAGALLGAVVAFLVARSFVRESFALLCDAGRVTRAADSAVGQLGWRVVLLARLAPILPFAFQNYFFGLTAVPLRGYVVASAIGMIPGTFAKIGIGTFAGRSTGEWSLLASSPLAIGVVLVLLLIALVAWQTRRNLQREREN